MDWEEFIYWMGFYKLEPFGNELLEAASLRAAILQPYFKEMITPWELLGMKKPIDPEREEQRAKYLLGFGADTSNNPEGKPMKLSAAIALRKQKETKQP